MTAIVLQCEILSEMLNGFLQWLAENEVLGFSRMQHQPTFCNDHLYSANRPPNAVSLRLECHPRVEPKVRNEANDPFAALIADCCNCFLLIASRMPPPLLVLLFE